MACVSEKDDTLPRKEYIHPSDPHKICRPKVEQWRRCHDVKFPEQGTPTKASLLADNNNNNNNNKLKLTFEGSAGE